MATDVHRRGVLGRTLAAFTTVTILIAAGPAGAEQLGSVTANFDAVTTTGNAHAGQALGTFTMAGARNDDGTVRITYRVIGRHMRATATLIGTKGILTIGARATVAAVVDDHQRAIGRWDACGGTGPYQRLVAYGDWTAVTDVLAGPTGNLPGAVHGAYLGRIDPSSAARRVGYSSHEAHC